MKIKALVCAGIGMLAFPGVGHAVGNECAVLPSGVTPDPVVVNYDPFGAAAAEANFLVDVRSADCLSSRNIFLGVDSDEVGVVSGSVVHFRGPSGLTIEGVLSNQAGRNLGGNDAFEVKAGPASIYLRVPRGQVVPPGDYVAQLRTVTKLNLGNNSPSQYKKFRAIVRVGVAIGLAPVDGTGIDLGELRGAGQSGQPVTFDAYANVGYRLRLISDYGYILKRDGASQTDGPGYIPLLDQLAIPTSGAQRDFALPNGEIPRRRHSLNVQVPTIDGFVPGMYRDYLTVEISARVGD